MEVGVKSYPHLQPIGASLLRKKHEDNEQRL